MVCRSIGWNGLIADRVVSAVVCSAATALGARISSLAHIDRIFPIGPLSIKEALRMGPVEAADNRL